MNDENVLCLLRDVTGEKCPVANRNLARACFPALDSGCIFASTFDWSTR